MNLLPFPVGRTSAFVAVVAWGSAAGVQGGERTGAVTRVPALEVSAAPAATEFAWLEESSDLLTWTPVAGGTWAGDLSAFRVMDSDPGAAWFCRMRTEQDPAGNAPASLVGFTAVFYAPDGSRNRWTFGPDTGDGLEGEWSAGTGEQGFFWSWQRTGRDAGQVEVTRFNGTQQVIRLQFSGFGLGEYVAEEIVDGEVEFSVRGAFSTGLAGMTGPAVPTGFANALMVLPEGMSSTSLRFTSAAQGQRTASGAAAGFTYVWNQLNATTATMNVSYTPTHWEEYTFTFRGPEGGRFTRKVFSSSVFADADDGSFSFARTGQNP